MADFTSSTLTVDSKTSSAAWVQAAAWTWIILTIVVAVFNSALQVSYVWFILLCGGANGIFVGLLQQEQVNRGEYSAVYFAVFSGAIGGYLASKDWRRLKGDLSRVVLSIMP
jgi:hypothetical protein